jgi:hypothetical protein
MVMWGKVVVLGRCRRRRRSERGMCEEDHEEDGRCQLCVDDGGVSYG